MSETKFTPGPWRAKSARVISAHREHKRFDGEVMEYQGEVAWTQPAGNDVERAANANLIAAAPELYEALEGAVESMKELGALVGIDHDDALRRHPTGTMARALAALAKARGETA